MRNFSLLFVLLLVLLSACSIEGKINDKKTIFKSEGEHWSISINNEVFERNGISYFTIKYVFKGDLEQLHQVENITFSQGTVLGTQLKNVYDTTYKERLVKEGHYEEEKTDQYGIIVDEIKNRNSKDFFIEYDLIQEDQNYTTLDAIEKDKIMVMINWETKDNKYQEVLQ